MKWCDSTTWTCRMAGLTALCVVLCPPLWGQRGAPALRYAMTVQVPADLTDLSEIARLGVSSKGVVALADYRGDHVVFVGADGKLQGSFGRAGEGPEEFTRIPSIRWRGDSAYVPDRKFTLIGSTRKLLRTARWDAPAQPNAEVNRAGVILGSPVNLVLLDDGTRIASVMFRPAGAKPTAMNRAYLRLSESSEVRSLVAVIPIELDGQSCRGPMCLRGAIDVGSDGRVVSLRMPDPDSPAPSARLTVFGPTGDTLLNRALPYEPVPLPKRLRDSLETARIPPAGGSGRPDLLPPQPRPAVAAGNSGGSGLPDMYVPKFFPGFTRALAGADGETWIEKRVAEPGHVWWRVDRTGNRTGTLSLPPEIELRVAHRTTVWGVRTDQSGLQSVVRLELR
jgi:hypothetical protein